MEKKTLNDLPYLVQFILFTAMITLSLTAWQFLLQFSFPPLFDMDYDPVNPEFSDRLMEVPKALFGTQITYHFFFFLIPALLFAFLKSYDPRDYLRLLKAPEWKTLALCIALMAFANVFAHSFLHLTNVLPLPESMQEAIAAEQQLNDRMMQGFFSGRSAGHMALVFFMIALLPAFAEEFLFRGVMQRFLLRWNGSEIWSIGMASVLFALMHGLVQSFLSLLFLGILLGYIYHRTGNLWYAIIAHLFNNGIQVVLLFAFSAPGEIKLEDADAIPIWASLLAVIPLGLLLIVFSRRNETDPAVWEEFEYERNTGMGEDL